MWLLHELLRQFQTTIPLAGIPDSPVAGVSEDSRKVMPGSIFVARGGTRVDGAGYVADAVARGAIAVVTNAKIDGCPVPQVLVRDPAAAVSVMANLFRDSPSQTVRVLGVTGTNGKTTTAYLIRHLLAQAKLRCGLIGTVEVDDGQRCRPADMTTPGAVDVADLLATMRDTGCRCCAMEVSSHALHQGRVAGVRFAAAGFTNLTGDHLDYHKDMNSYAAAKALLFEQLDDQAVAVTNAGSEWSARIERGCKARVLRFGFTKDADYQARDVSVTSAGSRFVLVSPDGRAKVSTRLIGKHNIENCLLAAALVGEAFALSAHQIAAGLRDATGAPGRLQPVDAGQPFTVLVDYAHTDDALKNVLAALRPLTRGKLRVLFGCGGDRDRTKRPRMAQVAEQLADAVYLTSDNPRTEEPDAIIREIRAGFSRTIGEAVLVEADRRAAIERALTDAQPGDVVLLAGKGHEDYQIVGQEKRHFDDAEEAKRVLAAAQHAESRLPGAHGGVRPRCHPEEL